MSELLVSSVMIGMKINWNPERVAAVRVVENTAL